MYNNIKTISPTHYHDTRDLAAVLDDPEAPEDFQQTIIDLFAEFDIDPMDPDATDVTIIPEQMFAEYVRDMLEDCGTIPRDLPEWVAIDWEETARAVSADYILAKSGSDWFYFRSC